MLFNSLSFAIFFLAVLPVYWALPKKLRNGFLLAASLLFYALWIPHYVLLLVGTLTVNYLLLQRILSSSRPKVWLVTSIAFSLGLLAYFKYAGFAVETTNAVLESMHRPGFTVPSVLLPLGISFFTFQIIGLAVDAYRHRGVVAATFSEYLLFISFFPHQIAGPILRGWNLLPQFREGGVLTAERVHRASWLIVGGLTKKVIFADGLLAPYANRVFYGPGWGSGAEHLLAMYSFAFQIYFDFSGYTDIARGVALLLGFELPLNFREPYLSRNPSEFWRRWHITLSEWLRDYLYIALGGNRGGRLRTYANLMLTMLLGGIWHGAGWNFLIWGAIHGGLLVVHRLATGGNTETGERVHLRDLPKILVVFHATCIAWIFFRATSFQDAAAFLEALVTRPYWGSFPVFQCAVIAVCAALHPLERWLRIRGARIRARTVSAPPFGIAEGLALGAAFGLVLWFAGTGGSFIYFQF